tara:strand:+ start:547 stop:807 length:261 start_codon:yes stop_codon:yes gene_type:complete
MNITQSTPKRTPRQVGHTNLARQVVYPVDMFEPNEKWVNVPGFGTPKSPNEWTVHQVWAPVRVKQQRVLETKGTIRNLDQEFEKTQ